MTEQVQDTNDDGLIAGQEVDFSTLMRVIRQGVKNAQPEPSESKPDTTSKPKRNGKSAKNSVTD